jgi:hypothetical protein
MTLIVLPQKNLENRDSLVKRLLRSPFPDPLPPGMRDREWLVHLAEYMVLVARLRVVGITVLSREFVTESIFATTKKATTM